MAVAMLCVGITFNILGGTGTIGGIGFASLALNTIVISQFAKVAFFEPADKNLETPELTITVYMIFFLCAMLGTYVFSGLRFRLPKALEVSTTSQTNLLYFVSVALGMGSQVLGLLAVMTASGDVEQSASRSFGLEFSGLTIFAIVLATDSRIRQTNGRHSFGLKVFFPWLFSILVSLLLTSRGGMIVPTLAYALTCLVSGYRFRRNHYLALCAGVLVLGFLISPFEMYVRQFREGMTPQGMAEVVWRQLTTMPDWTTVAQASAEAEGSGSGRSSYFNRPGTLILSRLSLIRTDSNLISACSTGYHYRFAAVKNDLLMLIPHFIYKDKPTVSSVGLLGHIAGVTGDDADTTFATITMVADGYGAFGWLGVISTGLFALPFVIIVYESIFDMRRPWGTVALGVFAVALPGANLGRLVGLTLRTTVELVLLSYIVGAVLRVVPIKAER